MGYFDAIASANFKTKADARRLFFPWGVWGRGYAIPTEQEYERLLRLMKIYTIVSLAVFIVAVLVLPGFWAFGVAALVVACYAAWLPSLLRGLQPSDEKLSITESMSTQARTHNAWMLWLLLIIALLFVTFAVVLVVIHPRNWFVALPAIVFFGTCAALFTRMLILRRRADS
jgi:NADH:ubiquinone oxidoreductase subunit 3 (subunit A)